MPGETKHYETRKSGVVLSKPHSPFLYFPKYLFLSRNFLENQKRPFTPGSILSPPSGLKIFQNFKNRILPPWVMSSLPSCRNLLAYHSYSKIFREMKRAIYPTGACIYGMDVLYLRQSYFLSVVILVLLFSISVS